jgi:hypothetical protein
VLTKLALDVANSRKFNSRQFSGPHGTTNRGGLQGPGRAAVVLATKRPRFFNARDESRSRRSPLNRVAPWPSDAWSSNLDNDSGNRNKKRRVFKLLSSSSSQTKFLRPPYGQRDQIRNGSSIYETRIYLSSGTRPPQPNNCTGASTSGTQP